MSSNQSQEDFDEVDTSCAQTPFKAPVASEDIFLNQPSRLENSQSHSPLKGVTPLKKRIIKWRQIKPVTCISNFFTDWWMGELLAVLISIASFLAIVIVLRKYDNRPVPKLAHGLSVNFIVSTLAALSKSSLLLVVASTTGQLKWLWMSTKYRPLRDMQTFDEASRGPLGSVRLLGSRLILSLVSIGAIITLLCLVFEPFFQGLISTPERVVYRDEPTAVINSLADYPDPLTYAFFSNDYRLATLIDEAVSAPSILPETSPQCTSGNCTWPEFVSLGFCYDCQNVTLDMQENSKTKDFHRNKSYPAQSDVPGTGQYVPVNIRNWNYTLPDLNGQILTVNNGNRTIVTYADLDAADSEGTLSTLALTTDWEQMTSYSFANGSSIPTASLNIIVQLSPQRSNLGAITSANLCALSFCAQRRNVSMSLNQLSSTILATAYGTQEDLDLGEGNWLSFTGDGINMTYPFNHTGKSPKNHNVLRWITALTSVGLIFNGNVTVPLNWKRGQRIGKDTLAALSDSPDIPLTMANVATALTNYYRDSSNTTVVGQSGHTEVYIHVAWPWIVLPGVLVVAGAMLLFLAMLETEKGVKCVWKTSELVLLLHALGNSDQDSTGMDKVSSMGHLAKGIQVKLENDDAQGWNLRQRGKMM